MSSLLSKEWLVFLSFQSIFSMYRGLASREKTIDCCNISLDELDCNLVLVFHCKRGEERERVRECDKERDKNRERKREKGKERERQEKK